MLSNVQLEKLFGIPVSTTRDWKNSKESDWRQKVFIFLKNQNQETVENFFKALEQMKSANTQK